MRITFEEATMGAFFKFPDPASSTWVKTGTHAAAVVGKDAFTPPHTQIELIPGSGPTNEDLLCARREMLGEIRTLFVDEATKAFLAGDDEEAQGLRNVVFKLDCKFGVDK